MFDGFILLHFPPNNNFIYAIGVSTKIKEQITMYGRWTLVHKWLDRIAAQGEWIIYVSEENLLQLQSARFTIQYDPDLVFLLFQHLWGVIEALIDGELYIPSWKNDSKFT